MIHHQTSKIEQQLQRQTTLAVVGGVHLNHNLEFQFYNFFESK